MRLWLDPDDIDPGAGFWRNVGVVARWIAAYLLVMIIGSGALAIVLWTIEAPLYLARSPRPWSIGGHCGFWALPPSWGCTATPTSFSHASSAGRVNAASWNWTPRCSGSGPGRAHRRRRR